MNISGADLTKPYAEMSREWRNSTICLPTIGTSRAPCEMPVMFLREPPPTRCEG
jgi:hypothetical protein